MIASRKWPSKRMFAGAGAAALLAAAAAGGYASAESSRAPVDHAQAERFGIPTGTTRSGLTYGSLGDAASLDEAPDLVSVVSDDGQLGFALIRDLNAALRPRVGQDPAAFNKTIESGAISLPVFAKDGITQIGTFTVGASERPGLDVRLADPDGADR